MNKECLSTLWCEQMIAPFLIALVAFGHKSHNPPCISTNATVTAMNRVYYIDGKDTPMSYGASTLRLSIETTRYHPLRFHHEGGNDKCLPILTVVEPNQTAVGYINRTGPLDNGAAHQYVYGNWQVVFPNDTSCHSDNISLVCGYHGYMNGMNGKNRLVWNDKCTASVLPSSSPPPPPPPDSDERGSGEFGSVPGEGDPDDDSRRGDGRLSRLFWAVLACSCICTLCVPCVRDLCSDRDESRWGRF